jgi:cell wall-associated NlpC family hydrolase
VAPSYSRSDAACPASQRHSIGRRIAALAAAAALLLGAGLAAALPALADPGGSGDTIDSVNAQLASLSQQAEQLTEQYNAAEIDVDAKTDAASTAQIAADAAKADFAAALTRFNGSIVDQYTSAAFSRTAALLDSQSGQDYLDQLQTLNLINVRRSADLGQLQAAKAASDAAQSQAGALLSQATAERDSLKQQKDDVAAEQDKYTTELNKLTAAQQAAYYAARSTGTTPTGQTVAAPAPDATIGVPPGTSPGAATAVQTALAQRGKPYIWAAAGPNAFDCSGLTAYAWAAAGVYLPHNAEAQYNSEAKVALGDLEPGDLVYYYRPISHVAMYIGNGMVVEAPTSGEVVKVVSTYAPGQPVGASRPG